MLSLLCRCSSLETIWEGGDIMLTNQQMLERSLFLIRRVFTEASKKRITLNSRKSGVSDITIKTYQKQMETMMREIARNCDVYDLKEIRAEHLDLILARINNPFSLKKFVHAVVYFQHAAKKTTVIRRLPLWIDKKLVLSDLREQGIVRRISSSTVYKATELEVLSVIQQVCTMRTPFKRQTADLLHFSCITGARIDGALNSCGKDIIIHSDEEADVHLLEKAGLHRTVRVWGRESVAFLVLLKDRCRSRDSRLFTVRNQRTGQIKSNKEAAKTIQSIIRTAAKRLEIVPDNQHFTTHSARKAFGHKRMILYLEWSTADLQLEIERRLDASDKLRPKFQRIMRRTPWRPVSIRRKLVLFLVSTDLGHGRLDVLSYYVSRDDLNTLLKMQAETRDWEFLLGGYKDKLVIPGP